MDLIGDIGDLDRLYDTFSMLAGGQVNLDDPTNLEGLEDPKLSTWMAKARETLKEYEAEKSALPTMESILATEKKVSKDLSTVTIGISSQLTKANILAEGLVLQLNNIARIRNSQQPHGYPQLGVMDLATNKIFGHLGDKLNEVVKEMSVLVDIIRNIDKNVSTTRVDYSSLVDQITRRLVFCDKVMNLN